MFTVRCELLTLPQWPRTAPWPSWAVTTGRRPPPPRYCSCNRTDTETWAEISWIPTFYWNNFKSPELLLTRCVPEMEFYSVSGKFDVPDVKVHSYCGILSRPEGIVSKASVKTKKVIIFWFSAKTLRVQFFQRCCLQPQWGEIDNHSWYLRV